MLELLRVDDAEWRDEIPLIRAFYASSPTTSPRR